MEVQLKSERAGQGSRPELMSPAGDWACAKAAVENGADAIYFGLDQFNARMRAQNFTLASLPKLMEFLHLRGVKGYVTFNILVFPNELTQAEDYLRAIIDAGVDAAIVQDVGICRLIRSISPDFPIHASTQMTITSAAGLEFAKSLGCSMTALARECSIQDIGRIHASQPDGMAMEVFVHGALCVAYSGQCLTSESLGGRSANRGVCAQACRLPYELICNGSPVALGDRRYLLSPQDLAGLEVLPELIQAGVQVFKIEGRLKSPEYVANITRIYRQAIDGCLRRRAADGASPPESASANPGRHPLPQGECPTAQYEMEMAFSRGLFTGWFRGVDNQRLVHARFGKKRGVYLGEVSRIGNKSVAVQLEASAKAGDGVVFDASRPDKEEEGGRIYGVEKRGAETWLSFGREDVDFEKVRVGDKIWKTDDPELDRRLRQSYDGDLPRYCRPVAIEVHGAPGQPMRLVVSDEQGRQVEAVSTEPLAQALKRPLDQQRLEEQLGRLGGTPFYLAELKNRLQGEVILPVSALNHLQRSFVQELEAARVKPLKWTLHDDAARLKKHPVVLSEIRHAAGENEAPAVAQLAVLVRNRGQLEAALSCGTDRLYCDFEDPKLYRDAVKLVAECGSCAKAPEIWIAPPRIFKPGEEWILRQIESAGADGYLVRNYDHLPYFAGSRCAGDYGFNVANAISADWFVRRHKLERITVSFDLNEAQIVGLLESAPPHWFEVVVHHHVPMFHMEHCVFCAFLSEGKDYHDCGRPCDKFTVELQDRVGARHALKADAGCRNTVYNALAQTGAEHLLHWIRLGLRHVRIDFLNESPKETVQTIAKYRQLMRGEISASDVWHDLKALNRLGITRGAD